MKGRELLGEVEHLVLLVIFRLGSGTYAVPIREELRRAGVDLSRGSIYVTLDRLERNGLVTSELGDPSPERGGRAKRFFRVTPRGLGAARETQRALIALWRDVPQLKERRS